MSVALAACGGVEARVMSREVRPPPDHQGGEVSTTCSSVAPEALHWA